MLGIVETFTSDLSLVIYANKYKICYFKKDILLKFPGQHVLNTWWVMPLESLHGVARQLKGI